MDLLFVNSLYGERSLGGAEVNLKALAEGAAARGHRVRVVSLTPEAVGSQQRDAAGVERIELPLANLYWPWGEERPGPLRQLLWHGRDAYNLATGRRLSALLAEDPPDLVEAENLRGLSAAVWTAVKGQRLPLVQAVHDYYFACPRSTMYRPATGEACGQQCPACRLLTLPRRLLSGRPDSVVFVSDYLKRRFAELGYFGGVARQRVIANPNLSEPPLRPLRQRRPGDPLMIGFLGRIEPAKGLETLLKAVKKLEGPWRLSIAGEAAADYLAELKTLAGAGPIDWLGRQPADAFLSHLDVLVVPSRWNEPAGRVVHEAYAHGVPVVGAAAGGIAEQIAPGETGDLFPPGDAAALAACLQRRLSTPPDVGRETAACRARAAAHALPRWLDTFEALWEETRANAARA